MKPIVVSWATPATRLYLSQGNSHEVASFDDDDSVQLPVIDSRDQPLSRLKIFLSQLDSACVQSHTVRFHVQPYCADFQRFCPDSRCTVRRCLIK